MYENEKYSVKMLLQGDLNITAVYNQWGFKCQLEGLKGFL
jgi:hypothetical protein